MIGTNIRCTKCNDTKRVCECNVLGFNPQYPSGYHPAHGVPYWEPKHPCYDCCEHEWVDHDDRLRHCTVCRVSQEKQAS